MPDTKRDNRTEPNKGEVKYTDIWLKYRKSHDYMQLKRIVSKTDRNWQFYIGNQWVGMKTGGEDLPSMNIIKPIVKYKVSTVSQQNLTANYSDASADNQTTYESLYRELNRKFDLAWDKAKMTDFAWKNNKAAAIQGESYAYFWSTEINDTPQLISNTSIMFGDENIEDIQEQPYILIRERLELKDAVNVPKGYTNHRRALTEEERRNVMELCKSDKRRNFILLMLQCGLRPSETTYIQGKDINKS